MFRAEKVTLPAGGVVTPQLDGLICGVGCGLGCGYGCGAGCYN